VRARARFNCQNASLADCRAARFPGRIVQYVLQKLVGWLFASDSVMLMLSGDALRPSADECPGALCDALSVPNRPRSASTACHCRDCQCEGCGKGYSMLEGSGDDSYSSTSSPVDSTDAGSREP
jgi:hypothetical protein